jgi:hypothetical protein
MYSRLAGKWSALRREQSRKAEWSILVSFESDGKVTAIKLEQDEKHFAPIDVREAGTANEVR